MRADDFLHPTPAGLYCPQGDFFIDPVRPVPRALITHGHGDHARSGHGAVLATAQTLDIMAIRYGEDFTAQRQVADGPLRLGGVEVSFHPAGHILGSAQIRLACADGPVIVVSGDYCRTPNPVCAPWEPVPCDIFVTEATFGLPVFRHPPDREEIARLLRSVAKGDVVVTTHGQLVLVATAIAVIIGVPLGILCARSARHAGHSRWVPHTR